VTWLVRVAAKGLKVAGFSSRFGGLARVAGKGVRENKVKVESLKLRVKTTGIAAQ
jgi:hypothetical protein